MSFVIFLDDFTNFTSTEVATCLKSLNVAMKLHRNVLRTVKNYLMERLNLHRVLLRLNS